MPINILQERSLGEIQGDFNASYPFLKIEFFQKSGMGQEKAYSSRHHQLKHDYKIREVRRTTQEGFLELNDQMTVAELEEIFAKQFGLNIQVFRRSGNLWLETTMTDSWTLKQQNDHGKEISTHHLNGDRR